MLNFLEEYSSKYCKVHKKRIYFFKKETSLNLSQCWDCLREANLKKDKGNKNE